jgi:hypothetical protein
MFLDSYPAASYLLVYRIAPFFTAANCNTHFYSKTSRAVRAVNRPHPDSIRLPALDLKVTIIAIQTRALERALLVAEGY